MGSYKAGETKTAEEWYNTGLLRLELKKSHDIAIMDFVNTCGVEPEKRWFDYFEEPKEFTASEMLDFATAMRHKSVKEIGESFILLRKRNDGN